MKATDWIKAINDAKSDKEIIKIWTDCLSRCGPEEYDDITLKVHKACAMQVVKASIRLEENK